ncbi:MAG: ornithine carbamoyltransferase [Myxococcales bacterium]|nr:MAG: ornithine carbamoyltransferase [Myxococcales bacterium]
MKNDFLTLWDLGTEKIEKVLARAEELKRLRAEGSTPRVLEGKQIAILLEKASTRTRVSFEVGIQELGANPLVLSANEMQLGRGESIEDTARVISRYLHAVVYRGHGHDRMQALAKYASISVINALSDSYHPCQLLADLLTIREHVNKPWSDLRVAWVGDGNNMAHSWINAAALLGFELRIASPKGYEPDAEVLKHATLQGKVRLVLGDNAQEAVLDADVVNTDVWASMGQESENEKRKLAFDGFCVSAEIMRKASDNAIFLHCLPAHRGEEVETSVLEGASSRIWDEAENRLHAQKALMEVLLSE